MDVLQPTILTVQFGVYFPIPCFESRWPTTFLAVWMLNGVIFSCYILKPWKWRQHVPLKYGICLRDLYIMKQQKTRVCHVERYSAIMWTGVVWPETGSRDRLLWTQHLTFRFHRWWNSWQAEQLLDSHKALIPCMQLILFLRNTQWYEVCFYAVHPVVYIDLRVLCYLSDQLIFN
jgi:hypothetical protein